MNPSPKIGISNQMTAEAKVVHSTIVGTNALGRISDVLIAWIKQEKGASQSFLADLRLLIQALSDFSCPKDGNVLGQIEMGTESEMIVIATRFECRKKFDLSMIEKELTQYWLNSDELKYLKKILYPHDRVEVRYHIALNLLEWRVYRTLNSENVPSHEATFSVLVDEENGLSAGMAQLVDAGDLPFQDWLEEIYKNKQTKNRSGTLKVEGGGEQDEAEWARIVVEREQEEIENSITFTDNYEETLEEVSVVSSDKEAPEATSLVQGKFSSDESAATRVSGQNESHPVENTLVSGETETDEDDQVTRLSGSTQPKNQKKRISKSDGSLDSSETVDGDAGIDGASEVAFSGEPSGEASKTKVKGKVSKENEDSVTFENDQDHENVKTIFKGDKKIVEKETVTKVVQSGNAKKEQKTERVFLSDDAISKAGSDYSDRILKEILADQATLKEKTKEIVIELKKEQLTLTRESGMLRQKLTKTEDLLKRKEVKIQQYMAEIKNLKARPAPAPVVAASGPNSDVFRQKAMDMFEKLKAVKEENKALEKAIEDMMKNREKSGQAGPASSDGAVIAMKKEVDELTKKVERTNRALEAEKEKMKALSERVIIAEKEAKGSGALVSDLEAKVEHQLKMTAQSKKETEQVKQKLVQSDQEKNKIKNELVKAQAQIQTLMKRQAA